MMTSKRWVIFEHVGAPDDLVGKHFDLLLEDLSSCRTWRLIQIPTKCEQEVEAMPLPNHRLQWLDTLESTLSRGRGKIKRIDGGFYKGSLPNEEGTFLQIEIFGKDLIGCLEINERSCRMLERKHNHSL